ncbi:hypothetical protein IV203_004697 [Nitzschia inconspicua]|uniref:Uncharacterized protein n=1 Tax=Nitzschia inconspicua TaxID=303405 RepID=A0A9K3L5T3_9STRA|nr:hypothetical protein IV203_004697 [Nitzschia inconspicua]
MVQTLKSAATQVSRRPPSFRTSLHMETPSSYNPKEWKWRIPHVGKATTKEKHTTNRASFYTGLSFMQGIGDETILLVHCLEEKEKTPKGQNTLDRKPSVPNTDLIEYCNIFASR